MDRRSGEPIAAAAEVLGDRWTLLILRDVIFADRRHFRALLTGSSEGIASNILADRLVRLVDAGLLSRGTAARGQRARYSLTEAGIRTLPILYSLGRWAVDWRPTSGATMIQQDFAVAAEAVQLDQLMDELRTRHLGGAAAPEGASTG